MASISLKYKSKSGNLTAPGDVDPGAMIPLASTTGNSTATYIEFTNIPANYEHLQIRFMVRNTWGINAREEIAMRFNSDTATNYSYHGLEGDGSSASANGSATQTFMGMGVLGGDSNTSGIFSIGIIDILDYANTNKYKTARSITGLDANGSGWLWMRSGLWRSTDAINTIRLYSANGQNLKTYSHFALYGIKRAGA